METNYNLAERLYQIKEGLSEVIDKRQEFSDSIKYRTETINITGARNRISDIATLLAKNEATEQEIDKQEQETVDEHFEAEKEREIEDEMDKREDDDFRNGEERVKDNENDLAH